MRLIILFFCFISACNSNYKEKSLNNIMKLDTKISIEDSISLHFCTGFNKDKVAVFVNDKEIFQSILTTDQSIGRAKVLVLNRLEINNLSVFVDNKRYEVKLSQILNNRTIEFNLKNGVGLEYCFSKGRLLID